MTFDRHAHHRPRLSPEELLARGHQEFLHNPRQAFADATEAYRRSNNPEHPNPDLAVRAGTLAVFAARQAGLDREIINEWESLTVQAMPPDAYQEVPLDLIRQTPDVRAEWVLPTE